MTRRTWVLTATIAALIGTTVFSALPANASHTRAIAPTQIDPTTLALPVSALPQSATVCLSGTVDAYGNLTQGAISADLTTSGALACGLVTAFVPPTSGGQGKITVNGKSYAIAAGATLQGAGQVDSLDHGAVSDNADANGTTTPADGFMSQLRIIHQKPYDQLGRLTGYRMDFHYFLQSNLAGTEYLASIYPSQATAKAAMDDAISPPALITIIGQPLARQCSVGDACAAYSGPNPGTTNTAVLAIFRDGPIVIETATQVPSAAFTALETTLETTLYGLLSSADQRIQQALNPSKPTNTPTSTATPTATPTATATDTPIPTPPPVVKHKKCPKNSVKKHGKCTCKKGYVKKHGKCVKKHKKTHKKKHKRKH